MCIIILKECFNMKINEINHQVKSIRNLDSTDVWLTQETFNILLVEANDICLNDEGILELHFSKNCLGISLKDGAVAIDDEIYYSRLVFLDDYYKGNSSAQGRYCIIL